MHKGVNTTLDEGQTLIANGGGFDVAHSLRGEGFDASEDGTGRGTPLVPISFGAQNAAAQGDGIAFDFVPALDKSKTPAVAHQVSVSIDNETLYPKGIRQNGDRHASPQETDAGTLLRALRGEVGEEAFAQWGLGILDTLQSSEVLRSEVHGGSVRSATDNWNGLDDNALPCAEDCGAGAVQSLWRFGCSGRSPSGWEPSEQLARQLGAHMSIMPHKGTPNSWFMLHLWESSEGLGVLRQALSAIQETWRPNGGESKSEHAPWAVRRLTPGECESLMGFPRGFTRIPYLGKPADLCPDGPRYKALGNSWAVNCADWIGERIAEVETWNN
jgi:hypothetical protein